jgi:hypothetical protein
LNLARPGPGWRRGTGAAGWALAAAGLLLAGAGAALAPGTDGVVARLGGITVSATDLRPGPAGTLIADMHVRNSGQPSDQLDAAVAASSIPVGVYHEVVNLGEIPDLTGCGGDSAPPQVVDHWLHYGPLLVPGRSVGSVPPAYATLTLQPVARAVGQRLAITLYFERAGSVTLELPVDRS